LHWKLDSKPPKQEAMKKIILAIALITGTAACFAGPNSSETNVTTEKMVSASIRSQIQFPEFLKEQEGIHSATIIFKVNDCGTIKIKDIQCQDPELKANLLNQAENFKVSTVGLDTRDTYKVVVKFQSL